MFLNAARVFVRGYMYPDSGSGGFHSYLSTSLKSSQATLNNNTCRQLLITGSQIEGALEAIT